jgi:hypothetical protein
MSKFKTIILISILLLLGGCFSKEDLNDPINQYLSKSYGIKNDFNILYADNNWVEGISHHTVIELKKPYHTYISLEVDRDSYEILQEESEDPFLQVFKGAYIDQHPRVLQLTKELNGKYGCIQSPEKYISDKDIVPYDNIRFNIEDKQQQKLEEDFKKTQKIDTIALLPRLNSNNPPKRFAIDFGVVNFIFNFDIYKNKHSVPSAEDIVNDFRNSGVLTEGHYAVIVPVGDSTPDIIGNSAQDLSSFVVFKVDAKGKYTIIPTPDPNPKPNNL